MDKIRLRNLSADYGRMRLMGQQADAVLAAAGLPMEEASDGEWIEYDGTILVRQQNYDVPGVEIVAPSARLDALREHLVGAGAVICADEAVYTARRIELGRPLPGAELTADYTPLEAGLAWACAENKGCYTGQEIIARQITYDKVTKTLVALRSAQHLAASDILTADGREVGSVTSAAFSPTLGAAIALGIVKRSHNQPGAVLNVNGQQAVVVEAGELSIVNGEL
jgi:folate-binding protein YgfZ